MGTKIGTKEQTGRHSGRGFAPTPTRFQFQMAGVFLPKKIMPEVSLVEESLRNGMKWLWIAAYLSSLVGTASDFGSGVIKWLQGDLRSFLLQTHDVCLCGSLCFLNTSPLGCHQSQLATVAKTETSLFCLNTYYPKIMFFYEHQSQRSAMRSYRCLPKFICINFMINLWFSNSTRLAPPLHTPLGYVYT